MQAGRPLRAADLMKPEIVQRNEAVTLVYRRRAWCSRYAARRTKAAPKATSISVLNEQSKRTVQGMIIGPGRVAVTNGSPRLAANNVTGSVSANAR